MKASIAVTFVMKVYCYPPLFRIKISMIFFQTNVSESVGLLSAKTATSSIKIASCGS